VGELGAFQGPTDHDILDAPNDAAIGGSRAQNLAGGLQVADAPAPEPTYRTGNTDVLVALTSGDDLP